MAIWIYNPVIAIHQNSAFQESSKALVLYPQFASARDRFASPAHTSTLGTGCVVRGNHQENSAN